MELIQLDSPPPPPPPPNTFDIRTVTWVAFDRWSISDSVLHKEPLLCHDVLRQGQTQLLRFSHATLRCGHKPLFAREEYSWPKYGMLKTDIFYLTSEIFKMYATIVQQRQLCLRVCFRSRLVKHRFRSAPEECRKTLFVYFCFACDDVNRWKFYKLMLKLLCMPENFHIQRQGRHVV